MAEAPRPTPSNSASRQYSGNCRQGLNNPGHGSRWAHVQLCGLKKPLCGLPTMYTGEGDLNLILYWIPSYQIPSRTYWINFTPQTCFCQSLTRCSPLLDGQLWPNRILKERFDQTYTSLAQARKTYASTPRYLESIWQERFLILEIGERRIAGPARIRRGKGTQSE